MIHSLTTAALTIGGFLLEHSDVLEDVAAALRAGTPKDAIRAAIRAAVVKTSDQAIREELEAAQARK